MGRRVEVYFDIFEVRVALCFRRGGDSSKLCTSFPSFCPFFFLFFLLGWKYRYMARGCIVHHRDRVSLVVSRSCVTVRAPWARVGRTASGSYTYNILYFFDVHVSRSSQFSGPSVSLSQNVARLLTAQQSVRFMSCFGYESLAECWQISDKITSFRVPFLFLFSRVFPTFQTTIKKLRKNVLNTDLVNFLFVVNSTLGLIRQCFAQIALVFNIRIDLTISLRYLIRWYLKMNIFSKADLVWALYN